MVMLNTNELMERLHASGFLEKKREASVQLLCTMNHYELPAYLHILMALGALLGTFFLFNLLIALDWLQQNNLVHLIAWGLGFIVLSLIIYYSLKKKTYLLQSAGIQTSLILMWLGKLLWVLGVSKLLIYQNIVVLDADERLSVGMFIVAFLTYFIYNLKIDRFVSCLLTLLFLLYNLYTDNNAMAIFAFFIVLLLSTGLLFVLDRKSTLFDPLAYAISIALSACCALVVLKPQLQSVPLLAYNLLAAFSNIALIYLILEPLIQNKIAFVLSIAGIIILALVANVAILLGLGFLLLGYWHHDRILTFLGGLLAITFIGQFFYALQISIYQKTIVLIVSGFILFAVSYIIMKMDWDGGSHA